jgi:hypothetical protein
MDELFEDHEPDEFIPEWVCHECGEEGLYIEIRTPIDLGSDPCPSCRMPVTCVY